MPVGQAGLNGLVLELLPVCNLWLLKKQRQTRLDGFRTCSLES